MIAGIEAIFGADCPVVRAMPNTPAAIGKGISVLCANLRATATQRALSTSLLEAVGETIWVESEDLMHAVTALSGGGPAYVFLLVETLARAGSSLGLPDDMAMRLARRTVEGSGALLAQSDRPASVLRSEVTSPGGTTQAALKVLMGDHGFQELCDKALAEAEKRSRELA
jgi:pyrroline-5-carboxylate reductase